MKLFMFLIFLTIFFLTSCQHHNEIAVHVKNTAPVMFKDQAITISLSALPELDISKLAAFEGKKELPSQLIDSDGDGRKDSFAFLLSLLPKQQKTVFLHSTDQKKKFKTCAHAELSVKKDYTLINRIYKGGHYIPVKQSKIPLNHKDHDNYYKCEGPCWESDKVAYRLYLDWRNSIDIFGKKLEPCILPRVGLKKGRNNADSYHTMADWGMDIFKVGNSLGIGTFAAYVNGKVGKVSQTDSVICTVTNDGPIWASVNTKYFGWQIANQKIDLNTTLTITAGKRLTRYDISLTGNFPIFCTGLAKHQNTTFLISQNQGDWGYIAYWGKQSLAGDHLGTALFYPRNAKIKLAEDALSSIVLLRPLRGKIRYYFAACWQQEAHGIKNKDQFIQYLQEVLWHLNRPLQIRITLK